MSHFMDNNQVISLTLRIQGVYLFSDGSHQSQVDPSLGTTNWIMESLIDCGACHGVIFALEHDDSSMKSFCAELTGILTSLMALLLVIIHHGITIGTMDVECNSDSAINVSQHRGKSHMVNALHIDLCCAISWMQDCPETEFGFTLC